MAAVAYQAGSMINQHHHHLIIKNQQPTQLLLLPSSPTSCSPPSQSLLLHASPRPCRNGRRIFVNLLHPRRTVGSVTTTHSCLQEEGWDWEVPTPPAPTQNRILSSRLLFHHESSRWQMRRRRWWWKRPRAMEMDGRGGGVLEDTKKKKKKKQQQQRGKQVEIAVTAAAVMLFGVGNRVLYKLALVPLKNYPFFLAQMATFGYLVVYFSILYMRYRLGIVTDKMLSLPKLRYAMVGLLEALAAASGMAAAANLSGVSLPILSQTFLVWQLLLSVVFLGRRFRANQIFGCLLVAVGVVVTVASGPSAGQSLKEAGLGWTLLMVGSFLLQAADTVLKETIFMDSRNQLEGGSVDLFVVNSFGSAFQALFICLLLPLFSKLWGVPIMQLPNYLRDGAACFLNLGSLSKGCEGAPVLPFFFVIVNMAFNISLLHLIKISSALVSCLVSTFSVPISIYVFTLPLPYNGSPSSLPGGFLTGAGVLLLGLFLYMWQPAVFVDAQPQKQ